MAEWRVRGTKLLKLLFKLQMENYSHIFCHFTYRLWLQCRLKSCLWLVCIYCLLSLGLMGISILMCIFSRLSEETDVWFDSNCYLNKGRHICKTGWGRLMIPMPTTTYHFFLSPLEQSFLWKMNVCRWSHISPCGEHVVLQLMHWGES